ncbi:MAG: mechanosensitive ion channel family protein [Planctomycetia bacterium]|nr:mechanosensitive ion channel family protein [Planctomycetia bacterium]
MSKKIFLWRVVSLFLCLFPFALSAEEMSQDAKDEKTVESSEKPGTVIVKIDADAVKQIQGNPEEKTPEATPLPLLPEEEVLTVDSLVTNTHRFWQDTRTYFRNNAQHFRMFLVGLLLTGIFVVVFRFLMKYVVYRAIFLHTPWHIDEMFYKAVAPPTNAFLWTTGIFLSALPLLQGVAWLERIFIAILFAILFWGLFRLIGMVDKILQEYLQKNCRNVNPLASDFFRRILKVCLILLAMFFIGQTVLGLNISALLAAAGIAGLAVAFAVKDSLANFFSSVQMIFDRSFQIGDRVRTNGVDGLIESVDFRCTRIRSLDGHLYIIPNSLMSSNVIENISDRPKIKYVFDLALTYSTTPEQLRHAKEILHRLTDNPGRYEQGERKPMIFFTDFKDWSLNINVILWFNTTDWGISQIWRHDLNLEILEEFNRAGLEFAFPTQTWIHDEPRTESVE